MPKVIDFRRILKKVRRSSIYRSSIDLLGSVLATKDLARDLPRHIERKLRRSPLHPLMMRVKSLLRSPVSIAPPIEIGPEGKIFLSLDQLCLLAGEHLRQQGISQLPRWERGWSIMPIIEDDAGNRLSGGECFLGLELSPFGQEGWRQ